MSRLSLRRSARNETSRSPRPGAALLAALAFWACASAGDRPPRSGGEAGPLPPGGRSAPELRVVYPPAYATLTASDSSFIFGSVRPADAVVTVNGVPARQAPGGGWLAWVPVVPGEFMFHLEARPSGSEEAPRAGSRTPAIPPGSGVATLDWRVRVPGFEASWMGVLDTASVTPRVPMELHPADPIRVAFRGTPGLRARALLLASTSGESLAAAPFVEEPPGEHNDGRRVFGPAARPSGDSATGDPAAVEPGMPAGSWSWYRAELRMPVPTTAVDNSGRHTRARESRLDSTAAPGRQVPAVDRTPGDGRRGPDGWVWDSLAIAIAWPDGAHRYGVPGAAVLSRDPAIHEAVLLDDDPADRGGTDGRVVARTAPDGVYDLFLPNGTRASADRRVGDFLELELAEDRSVWVPLAEAHPLPEGTPAPASRVPVVRTRRLGRWTRVVVPLSERLPVQVRQRTDPARYEVTIFGARAATEFMRTDFADSLVREIRWSQPASARFVLDVELNARQPWGFRYGYEDSDFYLDFRHAPELRSGLFRSVLKGLRIVVDPGHSPDTGATGPTGLPEKDANLAVALELARELDDKGAEVILTRTEEAPEGFGLHDRTALAAREEADLLVSVHHNALPDGVNPFESNGSSTYYYHPQSLPLARAIQAELLRELGLPDFGVAHGNLALARPTEMPAALTEAAFMMIPEQEELLRTEEFRKREAKAIRKGIERFLEQARELERKAR